MSDHDPVKEKILEAADLAEVVSSYVRLQPRGGRLFGLCPFHNEKTPSFTVHPERGFFHCFGCGKGGNVIDFVMGVENLTYSEARRMLAERFQIPLPKQGPKRPHEEIDRYQVMDWSARFYAKCLQNARDALDYLQSRGLDHQQIQQYGLGLAPPGWDQLYSALKRKQLPEAVMIELGLVVPKRSGHGCVDRFRNRIMFPIRNTLGRVIAFGGRALDPDDPAKYLNSSDTPLFNKSKVLYLLDRAKSSLSEQGAVVVEGYMDALSLHAHGFEQTVATLGTSLTQDHARLLRRYTRNITLLYDGDSAGIRAAWRGVEIFLQEGISVQVAQLPPGVDPDDYVRQEGPQAMQAMLDQSREGFDFLLTESARGRDLSQMREKQAAIDAVIPALAGVPDPLMRDDSIKRLTAAFGGERPVVEKAVMQRIQQSRRRGPADEADQPPSAPAGDQEPRHIRHAKEGLLRLLAFHHGLILPEAMRPAERPWLFTEQEWQTLLPQHLQALQAHSRLDQLLFTLLNNRPGASHNQHAAHLDTLFPDNEDARLFLHITESEALPNNEKDLKKMTREIIETFEQEIHRRQADALLRETRADSRQALERMNEILFKSPEANR